MVVEVLQKVYKKALEDGKPLEEVAVYGEADHKPVQLVMRVTHCREPTLLVSKRGIVGESAKRGRRVSPLRYASVPIAPTGEE